MSGGSEDLICPECGAPMALTGGRWGLTYRCQKDGCRGSHGASPDGSPLGTPADRRTRAARMKAHDAFDRIWSHGTMSRTDAYRWMAEVLGTPAEEVHIASLDKEGCARVVEAVRSRFPDLFPIEPVDADP